MEIIDSNPEEIRELILNSKEPLLFKDLLVSELLTWDLADWSRILSGKELEFRTGVFEYTKEPQWERKTNLIKGSFEYFLRQAKLDTKNWLYFDYKYLKEWLIDTNELRRNIAWDQLGFPDVTVDECAIWIGSNGAHTPCHVDTYGFNLIYQVYGSKLWIVAPPEENLKPTRIPYEESSIYSKLNFFSPTPDDFKGIDSCRKIVLNRGDVLFLPHKWWHYVENLGTAISINVWIPHPQDDDERFKESVVQLLVKQTVALSSDETNKFILNPNMEQVFSSTGFETFLGTLTICKDICKYNSPKKKKFKGENDESAEDNAEVNQVKIMEKYRFIERVPKLSSDQFKLFLMKQRDRFQKNAVDTINVDHEGHHAVELMNVLTDSDVVSLICEKLLASRI